LRCIFEIINLLTAKNYIMETLVKRDGLFPTVVNKLVNPLFEDFFTRDISDWTDKTISSIGVNLPSVT
jgi:HSP20 family protein